MKTTFSLFSILFCLSIFQVGFAQGPPLPPGAETSPFEQKNISSADLKKLLVGEWVLENDKSQGFKITATTFANTIKEFSHKAVSYKVSNKDKCTCDLGELPPPPMLLGCISIPNTKNCYLIYDIIEGDQITLSGSFVDPLKEIVKVFTVVKK